MKIIALTQFFITTIHAMSTHDMSTKMSTKMSTEKEPSPKETLDRVTRGNTKAMLEQNKICFVLASQINSVQNLLIIKQRYPILFDHCKLKIKASKSVICKRFGWKARSVHC